MSDLTLEQYKNEEYLDFQDPSILKAQQLAIEEVRAKFGKDYLFYSNGKWQQGEAGTFKSINPSNLNETIGTFQKASSAQALKSLDDAWTAYNEWQFVPAQKRADYLFTMANIMKRRRLEINAWMISEAGKNYVEADADTAEAIDFVNYYAYEALRMDKGMPVLSENWGDFNRTIYMPIGAGVSISPWNFPFAIFVGMAIAPIAVGNTVVAKPAPDTPKMGQIMAEIVEEANLPAGVFNYVTGDNIEVGETLARSPKTRFISFTGSKAVGLHLTDIAAQVVEGQHFLKRMICELGGKNATVVDKDADLDSAAEEIVKGAFGFQGQKCSAGSRTIAVKEVYDSLLEKVVEKTKQLTVGDAKDNYPAGPVVNEKAVEKIMHYIEVGKNEGKLMCGGTLADTEHPGHYISPTVFADISEDAVIAQEEIFGPVTAFIKAEDTKDAIRIANNTQYGLTGAYFSNNPDNIEYALRHFRVGNLYINRKCTGALVGAQPFGGFNLSGTDAKAGGRDYLKYFLEPKSMTLRPKENVAFRLKEFSYTKE
jgi:1-pyrroline-5-carboxylate dehydrogenase